MKYFWSAETDIPAGNGYEMFGGAHLAVLLLVIVFLSAASFIFRRSDNANRIRMLRMVALSLPILETIKMIFLTCIGHMGIGYLPLHLCSMSIFLYPVIALSKNRFIQEILSEISVCTLLPAAVSALVFPDWTMYPMLSFMNIYAYLWHTLQVLFPLLCLYLNIARPHVRHLWWNTLFLIITGTAVYIFDRRFSCNYWFLLWPVPGTPLVKIWEIHNGRGYIPVLLLTATLVNLCMYRFLNFIRNSENKGK